MSTTDSLAYCISQDILALDLLKTLVPTIEKKIKEMKSAGKLSSTDKVLPGLSLSSLSDHLPTAFLSTGVGISDTNQPSTTTSKIINFINMENFSLIFEKFAEIEKNRKVGEESLLEEFLSLEQST